MAQHTASAVLQLPHYGRPRNLLRRSDGRRRIPALAGKALHGTLGALADLAQFPAAVIANTAGWMTAEIGRQPWLAYGLLRTSEGYSKQIGAGTSLFTLLGFLGLYSLLSILWIVLVYSTIQKGPSPVVETSSSHSITTA
jgi:cytochrome bd-type quinol oxidase subunit 1